MGFPRCRNHIFIKHFLHFTLNILHLSCVFYKGFRNKKPVDLNHYFIGYLIYPHYRLFAQYRKIVYKGYCP